jgi:hypothetical protein
MYTVEEHNNTVNNFLHRDSKSSTSSVASPPPPQPQPTLLQQQQHSSIHTPPQPTSPSDQPNRLPSIHSLSSSYPTEPKLEHRDLPPLGFQNYNNHKYQSENEEYMKKRKR